MFKIRLIPILLLKNSRCTKGIHFNENFRDTGYPVTAAKIYNSQDADELIFLDITATNENRKPYYDIFSKVSENCFMPLTLGGGIKSIDDIKKFLLVGADKVAINSEAVKRPEFITQAAMTFGSQCIVLSIDVKKIDDKYKVFTHSGLRATMLDPVEWAKEAEKRGAGEILLTSIDQEGTMQGYDLNLIRSISDVVKVPVIAAGGVGKLRHFVEAVDIGHASAVAASSIFHFTDQSVMKARAYMKEHGLNVRIV